MLYGAPGSRSLLLEHRSFLSTVERREVLEKADDARVDFKWSRAESSRSQDVKKSHTR